MGHSSYLNLLEIYYLLHYILQHCNPFDFIVNIIKPPIDFLLLIDKCHQHYLMHSFVSMTSSIKSHSYFCKQVQYCYHVDVFVSVKTAAEEIYPKTVQRVDILWKGATELTFHNKVILKAIEILKKKLESLKV